MLPRSDVSPSLCTDVSGLNIKLATKVPVYGLPVLSLITLNASSQAIMVMLLIQRPRNLVRFNATYF